MTALEFPKIEVFGKENCPNCEDLKEFLDAHQVPHTEHSMDYHGVWHQNWREDGSVDALAAYQYSPALPLVKIDGVFYDSEKAKTILEQVARVGLAS